MTSGHIISTAFSLYERHWKTLLQYSALIFAPSLLNYIIVATLESFPILVISIIVTSLLSLWFSLSLVRALIQIIETDRALSLQEDVREGARLILPTLLTSILVFLAVAGGIFLFIIPGIIFSIWFAFTNYAVVVDGKRGIEALKASKVLVKGRWWAVFLRLVIPGLAIGFMAWILQIIVDSGATILADNPDSLIFLANDIINMIITLVIAPLGGLATAILYTDLKKNPVEQKPAVQ